MGLDRDTKKQIVQTIKNNPAMIQQQDKHMCKESAHGKMEKIAKDIAKFSSYQFANSAALLIQSCFRTYIAKKESIRVRAAWNQARVDALSALIKREKTYVFTIIGF